MSRQTYILRNGALVNKATGFPAIYAGDGVCSPMVVRDIPEYRSPIDGRIIGSRSERREDLKRNNCVEYEPSAIKRKEKMDKNT